MDESYGARYAELYRGHWWWRAREELLDRLLQRLLQRLLGAATDRALPALVATARHHREAAAASCSTSDAGTDSSSPYSSATALRTASSPMGGCSTLPALGVAESAPIRSCPTRSRSGVTA